MNACIHVQTLLRIASLNVYNCKCVLRKSLKMVGKKLGKNQKIKKNYTKEWESKKINGISGTLCQWWTNNSSSSSPLFIWKMLILNFYLGLYFCYYILRLLNMYHRLSRENWLWRFLWNFLFGKITWSKFLISYISKYFKLV